MLVKQEFYQYNIFMDIIQVVVLSIVESLTEFIPVSSTGHLILTQKLFNWDIPFAFDLIIQLGAFLAVIIYFFPLIKKILLSIFKVCIFFIQKKENFDKKPTADETFYSKLGIFIFIASIPSGIIGFVLADFIESYLHSEIYVAVFMFLFSFVMLIVDKKNPKLELTDMSFPSIFKMGLWQILAILPGVSRSGACMAGGLTSGFNRSTSAKIGFLLGLPIIIGGGLKGFYDLYKGDTSLNISPYLIILGLALSFVTGFFVIKFLIRFLEKNSLKVFIYYRIALSLMILLILFVFK
jgi:undecaprenyl-diphosphatase